MDLPCPKCGEPWDFDSLHEETEDRFHREGKEVPSGEKYQKMYRKVAKEFRTIGCPAIGGKCNKPEPPTDKLTRAEAASVLYDLLGDDMDGAAAMLEDFELGF